MLGGFQYNADRAATVLQSLEEMTAYFRRAIEDHASLASGGLIHALATAEIDGDRLTDDEVIANAILTMVGGQETTTTLIGNGMLSLLANPDQWRRLKDDPNLIASAVEELLRYESPSQHTARVAREDYELGDKVISKGQVVAAVMGAANRDPERFEEPDRLDLGRTDNRHLAFGWGGHVCFGAHLARIEGRLAFTALADRMGDIRLVSGPLKWKQTHGLRGLEALLVEI
jgi:cytochrome P450